MVLEYICSNGILKGKKINIPREATHYKIKSEKIKFFYFNERENFQIPGVKKLPFRAIEVEFNLEKHFSTIEYGNPIFYDSNSIILKTNGDWFKNGKSQ